MRVARFGAIALVSVTSTQAFAQYDAVWSLNGYQIFLQGSQQQQSVSPQDYSTPPNLPSLQLSDMFGSQSATVQASDAPTLAVTSSGVGGDFESGGGSNFQMEYWVKVNAPDNSPQIQVGVEGLLTANTSFNSADPSGALVAAASAQTQIDATDNTMVFSADAEDGTSSTVAVDTTFAQDTNVWFEVLIFASAGDAINEGTASASATVDPYFYIPSTVPNHQDYSIAVSDGILNSPPSGVPEPSTWTMMLAGGAALGLFGARKRRLGRVAVALQ